MTENEKIELFDKWYDENYDEWAEGEEGIALREELEQAFKSGIATLEKENERLTVSYETLKLHDEEEIGMLKSENAELKEKLGNYQKGMFDEIEKRDIKLTKAKEIIKDFILVAKVEHLKDRYETVDEAEQFLKESEK